MMLVYRPGYALLVLALAFSAIAGGQALVQAATRVDFLAPEGRPIPVESRSNDLWHRHVNVVSDDPEIAASAVRKAGFDWVSPGAIKNLDNALGYDTAALVRDGDGHGVLLRAD